MTATIKLSLSPNNKLHLKVGDKIAAGTIIYAKLDKQTKHIIPLAILLNAKPSSLLNFFKKKLGEVVSKDDVIAIKKNILSQVLIKSPVSGKLDQIDLKEGTLTIIQNLEKTQPTVIPFSSHVIATEKTSVEIEIEGQIIEAQTGAGLESIGALNYIVEDTIDIFKLDSAVEGKIIAAKSASSEALFKLDALGAAGIICQNKITDINIPWVKLTEGDFKKINKLEGIKIWLRPKEHQVIIPK